MSNLIQNLIILSVCWTLSTAGGAYVTLFQQPKEMERLEKARKVERMKQAELSALMAEMGESASIANSVVTRWNARYKVVPRTLGSEELIGYLNSLTRTGFNPFNISFKEHVENKSFNKFSFGISGRGDFSSVYRLIWSLENGRRLYRIHNLKLNHFDLVTQDPETKRQKMEVVVSFSFILEAFYGGIAGFSAADEVSGAPQSVYYTGEDPESNLPLVPDHLLPSPYARMNPFHPLILENIPPNTYNLPNMEEASLSLIVGMNAVLDWNGVSVTVGIGDPVYLGQVISVDPRNGTVVARLNKGGIVDEIELRMDMEASYRQAQGNVQLTSSQHQ